jgi:hypothetical protein
MWLQAIAPSQELTASSVVCQGVSFQRKRAASNLPPKARSPAHQSVPLPQADISGVRLLLEHALERGRVPQSWRTGNLRRSHKDTRIVCKGVGRMRRSGLKN